MNTFKIILQVATMLLLVIGASAATLKRTALFCEGSNDIIKQEGSYYPCYQVLSDGTECSVQKMVIEWAHTSGWNSYFSNFIFHGTYYVNCINEGDKAGLCYKNSAGVWKRGDNKQCATGYEAIIDIVYENARRRRLGGNVNGNGNGNGNGYGNQDDEAPDVGYVDDGNELSPGQGDPERKRVKINNGQGVEEDWVIVDAPAD